MVEGAAGPAKNPDRFRSSQPRAPRSTLFGELRTTGVKILACDLCGDPGVGARQLGIWQRWVFPVQGTPSRPTLIPPHPKVWDAFGARLGPRRRCRDAGAQLTPAEPPPPPPGGRIRLPGSQSPARAASSPSCALRSEDAGAAVRGGRRGGAGPLAGREAEPGGWGPSRRTGGPSRHPNPVRGRRPPEPQPRLREPLASPPRSPPHSTHDLATWGRSVKLAASQRGWRRRRTHGGGRSREGAALTSPLPPEPRSPRPLCQPLFPKWPRLPGLALAAQITTLEDEAGRSS